MRPMIKTKQRLRERTQLFKRAVICNAVALLVNKNSINKIVVVCNAYNPQLDSTVACSAPYTSF